MFRFGSLRWPGLAKVLEECGEVVQVIGKLIMTNGDVKHWEGEPLDERLTDEMADAYAAIQFAYKHAIGQRLKDRFEARVALKYATFERWHREQAE